MRGTLCIVAILLAGPQAASETLPQQAGPPKPGILEFLGETAGLDPEIIEFMATREAKRAMKKAPALPDDSAAQGVAWNSMDPAVQSLLVGEEASWDTLPAERQRMLADGAARWLAMKDTDRAAATARYRTWSELPTDDRERMRERCKRFRNLAPEQQQALRDAYRRFLELPPERRAAMLDRWEQMSAEEMRRAIQRRQGPKPGGVDRRPCPPC